MTPRSRSELAVWSPCNRLVAITGYQAGVDILDAATLQRLQSFEFSQPSSLPQRALAFSPDSRTLTSFIHCGPLQPAHGIVVSWDLQTGGVVSTIHWEGAAEYMGYTYIAYSMNGRMVAALCLYQSSTVISIYDIASGVHLHDIHNCTYADPDFGAQRVYKFWTHGESLRFATPGSKGITIWEVGFAPGATPMEVETVPFPDDTAQMVLSEPMERSHIAKAEFHPASYRLAFIYTGAEHTLLVWDARASRFILHYANIDTSLDLPYMTFSSDGCLFACATVGPEVCLWKESPTGYTLLEKFAPATPYPHPSLSPNGESIIISGFTMVQLWHTKRFTATSGNSLQRLGPGFILEFSPGRPLAVAARRGDHTVTVLNLKSGAPQFIINTSIGIIGLGSIGNTIVVIGDQKAITWDLPGEDSHPDTRMDIKDSIQTINFGNEYNRNTLTASISTNGHYIALMRHEPSSFYLDVYSTLTGQHLHAEASSVSQLWFAPGGHQIWSPSEQTGKVTVFTITQDTLDSTSASIDIEGGLWGCPWGSSRGYKVTEDGWILGAGGERLMMLPPLWRSQWKEQRVWNEKFLALLHGGLSEVVILELEP